MIGAYRPGTQLFASHVNVGAVDLALYSLPLIDFLNLARQNSYEFQRTYNPSTLLRSWSAPVTNPPNRVHYDLLTISTQGPRGAAPQTPLPSPRPPPTHIHLAI